jgi:hypothetical protein
MGVALDASTPGRNTVVNTAAAAAVTVPSAGTFTPPNNSFIVVCIEADTFNSSVDGRDNFTFAITNSGTALTWTMRVERTGQETTAGGAVHIFTAPMVTGAAISVTATKSGASGAASNGSGRISMKVRVWTGVDIGGTPVDSVTASNEGTGTTQTDQAFTALTPGANGVLIVAATEWNTKGAVSSSDLTIDHAEYALQIDVADGYKTVTSGVSATGHMTAGAAGPQWKWAQIIVREAATAATFVSYQPQYARAPVMAQ